MKVIQISDNTATSQMMQIAVTNKDYKTLEQLQYCGGFLRFNMSIYDEQKKRCKTDKDNLIPFLEKVFVNSSFQDYFK
jgi:hypothetical protein